MSRLAGAVTPYMADCLSKDVSLYYDFVLDVSKITDIFTDINSGEMTCFGFYRQFGFVVSNINHLEWCAYL
eukprot:5375576-Amphidinium_carterae.1